MSTLILGLTKKYTPNFANSSAFSLSSFYTCSNLDIKSDVIMKKGGDMMRDDEKWVLSILGKNWFHHQDGMNICREENEAKINVNMVWSMYVGRKEIGFANMYI